MAEPQWKRLVEELTRKGHQSPSLERLRERLPGVTPGAGLRDVELEIAQEMASALGRAGEKVDVALLELEALGRDLDESPEAPGRAAKVAAFNRQREVVLKYLWELKVHREALGMRRHDWLARTYPVPPPRR